MAVYRGEAFLETQLASVLSQLAQGDELVISYDRPADCADKETDPTWQIISEAAKKDPRILLTEGPCKGAAKNFENALRHCAGDVIFLCDQDDCWLPNKREAVLAAFSDPKLILVLHDASVTDEALQIQAPSFFAKRGCRLGFWRNLLKNSFIGCCMAFRRELIGDILPFPDKLPMHDQWIGLTAGRVGRVALLPEPLLLYRRHGKNASGDRHEKFSVMLKWRLRLLFYCLKWRRHGK